MMINIKSGGKDKLSELLEDSKVETECLTFTNQVGQNTKYLCNTDVIEIINLNDYQILIYSCTFNNIYEKQFSLIYLHLSNKLSKFNVIDNCKFQNCQTYSGMIYINAEKSYENCTITNCLFENNTVQSTIKYEINLDEIYGIIQSCKFINTTGYGYICISNDNNLDTEEKTIIQNNFFSIETNSKSHYMIDIHTTNQVLISNNKFDITRSPPDAFNVVYCYHLTENLKITSNCVFPYNEKKVFLKGLLPSTVVINKTEAFQLECYQESAASDPFSYSDKFSKSNEFSNSLKFIQTSCFSNSNFFTETQIFSISNGFSVSQEFTRADIFKDSAIFSRSCHFSLTNHFSESSKFSSSHKFTVSDMFSGLSQFSESMKFQQKDSFSKLNEFSYASEFSQDLNFSKVYYSSESNKFSSSLHFAPTNEFLFSDHFKNSIQSYQSSDENNVKISSSAQFQASFPNDFESVLPEEANVSVNEVQLQSPSVQSASNNVQIESFSQETKYHQTFSNDDEWVSAMQKETQYFSDLNKFFSSHQTIKNSVQVQSFKQETKYHQPSSNNDEPFSAVHKENKSNLDLIIALVFAAVVVIVVTILMIIVFMHRKKKNEDETYPVQLQEEINPDQIENQPQAKNNFNNSSYDSFDFWA